MNKYTWIVLIACNVSTSFAAQPTFSIVATTPTSISVPANRHAYVQYKVTNNTSTTQTLTMLSIANVTQLTTDNSQCSNPFTLAKNQSCNLTLYVDGAQQTSTYAGGPVICKTIGNSNKPNAFLCSRPERSMGLHIYPANVVTPSAHKLYVSNWNGGSISLCYINDSGDINNCLVSAVNNTFLNPEALAVKDTALFVANIGGSLSSCLIDSVTGDLSECGQAVSGASANQIHAPDGIAIEGSTAYIANSGPESFKQGVTTCNVNGKTLGSCVFTQGLASFSIPSDLAFFNNTVYITNFDSQNLQTTYCIIGGTLCTNPAPGSISQTSGLLNEPEGLHMTTLNSLNYAYFTNHGNNTVTLCTISAPSTFTNCANTEGYFSGFGNLAILNDTQSKAFIPSGLKTIATCDVNTNTGTLSSCINSPETAFNNPSGLVIN